MSAKEVKFAELQELLDPKPVLDQLEVMEYVCQDLKVTHDDDARRELPDRLENPADAEDLYLKFDLLALLLQAATTIEELAQRIDATYCAERQQYEENMQGIFAQTKPYEKTARALNLLYENAGGEAAVWIMPVQKAWFADSANPKHFDAFRHHLRQQFYAWKMANSPFYISYVGDIGSKSAMDKMAAVAQETRALAIVDLREMASVKAVMDYADRLQITGIPAHLAHLVIPGTWVYAHGAVDVDFVNDEYGGLQRRERPMAVPAAGALIGKLLDVPPGYYITGMEGSAIVGINGVRVAYDLQRIDAKEWDKRGLIQIEPYGHIQGATTANKSNNHDLRKFPKVDIANALLKDLVQFCNNKAFSKWGKKEKRAAEHEIMVYLNRRFRQGLIEGYEIVAIEYDTDEETVSIEIMIRFAEVADEFDINLHGPRQAIDIVRKDPAK
jgi:hypothetical protein